MGSDSQLSSRAKFAMAVGKNKRLTKGKKGSKKEIIDPFASKDWYYIKAPSIFQAPIVGKTIVSRTKGTKTASDGLKGRICEISLGDLNKNEDDAYRKMKLRAISGAWTSPPTSSARWCASGSRSSRRMST